LSEYLHIVCLDAPAPPDYGGAIDMYYKIKALADAGKKIILHYFTYRNNRHVEGLEKYCVEINAYERKRFLSSFSITVPYIVSSRINRTLISRLNQDDHPIILEGIHCSGILPAMSKDRKVTIRMHNDEAVYYDHLYKSEERTWKKKYFSRESNLLKRYQSQLERNLLLCCLSEKDVFGFRKDGFTNVHFIPCFIPWKQLNNKDGRGDFCLYHGNMHVKENESAALWLIREVFSQVNLPLIVAGNGISKSLQKEAELGSNIQLRKDISMTELNQLVSDAQIHVLPSMNNTGVKLKLLHALFEGRFCFTNAAGVEGSGIENCVSVLNTAAEWRNAIEEGMNMTFSDQHHNERGKLLALYNNKLNAEKLIALL
jgi:hypothetical protein